MMDVVPLEGGGRPQCAKQSSAGPGQTFFLLMWGVQSKLVAGQNFLHTLGHL